MEIPFASAADITEEEQACLDFYRSMRESAEEESLYYRRLADRVGAQGHQEAASTLEEVAAVWEEGSSEEATEESISAQMAEAGHALTDAGHQAPSSRILEQGS